MILWTTPEFIVRTEPFALACIIVQLVMLWVSGRRFRRDMRNNEELVQAIEGARAAMCRSVADFRDQLKAAGIEPTLEQRALISAWTC